MKRKQTNRAIIVLLAMALVLGCAIGGTVAWLTDETEEVKNTFTTSDVDIDLTETTGTSYKMVPGDEITKDPKVTVKAGSEKCYVFVKVEKSETFDTFMTYDMAEGWTVLDDATGVYYQIVNASTADQNFAVLANDKVTVKDTVTKANMDALTTEADLPTLTFTAYACQWAKGATNFEPAAAWAQVSTP